jgi:hypothetical protein
LFFRRNLIRDILNLLYLGNLKLARPKIRLKQFHYLHPLYHSANSELKQGRILALRTKLDWNAFPTMRLLKFLQQQDKIIGQNTVPRLSNQKNYLEQRKDM